MAIINVTREDVKRSTVLTPGWYRFKVKEIATETNKKQDANNYVTDIVGTAGEAQDVPVRIYFSEKAMGMMVPFILACGGKIDPEQGGSFDPDAFKDRELEVFIKNETWEGKLRNNAADYRPVGSGS